MQKQKNFRQVLRRRNLISEFILNLFLAFSSYPRLILEVFIRKNLGERYFSLESSVALIIVLSFIPVLADGGSSLLLQSGYGDEASGWGKYVTWYAFIVLFAFFSYKRWKEVKALPSVFDFKRYSLDSGDINPFFFGWPVLGKDRSLRKVEMFYEPAPFFIAGVVLWLIGQSLGMFLIICSAFYCLGYAGAYKMGDDYVMDKIDDLIIQRGLKKLLRRNEGYKLDGLQFRMRRPLTEEQSDMLADEILAEYGEDVAVVK